MRRCNILAGFVLSVALLGGCQKLAQPGPWSNVVAAEELAKASLRYYWRTQLVLDPGETLKSLWQVDQDVYVLTSVNRLIAVDGLSGSPRWNLKVGSATQQVFAPCHVDDVSLPEQTGIREITNPRDVTFLKPFNAVIINTLSFALVIDRLSGQVKRQLNFSFAANTGGSCDGTYFYVASVTGRYFAVRLSEGLAQWEMSGENLIAVRPVLFNHRLYIATMGGKFMCVTPDRSADRHLWTQNADGPLTAEFVVDARGCFVPCQDFRLYAFDAVSGGDLWTFITQGPLTQAAQASARSIFQYADRDRFYCVDVASGRKRWDDHAARTVLGNFGDNVAILSADRRLMVVDEMTGQTSYTAPMTGLSLFVPNASRPAIYVASSDGKVACIREGKGLLKPEMLTESTTQPAAASQPSSAPSSAPVSSEPAVEAAPAAPPAEAPIEGTPAQTPPPTVE